MNRQNFGTSQGVRDLHLAQWLQEMAIGYTPQGIIADALFPVVRVGKQTDWYTVFSRQEALTIEDTTRAPGTEAKKITRSVSTGTYMAKNYALKTELTLEDRVNMDAGLAMELIGGRAKYVQNKLYLDWEKRVSNLVNSTSNVGSSATVSSAWNGAGSPLTNLWTALDNVKYATGYRPNKIVMGARAWDSLRRDSTVRNLLFGTNNGGGYPSLDQVKNIFEVQQALVGQSFFSNANEAQAEALQVVWPDNVLLAYVAPTPTREDPSYGYSFRWVGNGLAEFGVELHPYDPKIKAEEVEMGYYQDEKITGSQYSFLIRAVNSSQ
jgi:hypothetical protein